MTRAKDPKTIVSHDPRWAAVFRTESRSLADALGPSRVELHHIGSTAVPGLVAKPTVDILLVAPDLDAIDAGAAALQALGYEARGAYGVERRRYFARLDQTGAVRGFHVHGFARGDPHVTRHLRFRDVLIARPDIAEAYAALKRGLAGPGGVLPPDYAERKSGFIVEILDAALNENPGA